MKKAKIISTIKLFENKNKSKSKPKKNKDKYITKNNLLLKINEEKPLSFYRTFSLNNIKIKTNNKDSIEINKNKNIQRPFSPQNKIEILEKKIKIIKDGNFYNSLQNLDNLRKQKLSLQKRVNTLINNIQELKKKNNYNKINEILIENNNIKTVLYHKANNPINIIKEISEENNSLKNKIKIENKNLKYKTDIINKIKYEINEMNEQIKKIKNDNNELIKEKYNLINKINTFKKKNENLKKDINKYDILSNELLNGVEEIIKIKDS